MLYGSAMEAMLRPLGIKRVRRRKPRPPPSPDHQGDGGGGPEEDLEETWWEADPVHMLAACVGAALGWWALGKLKALQTPYASPEKGGASVASFPAPISPRIVPLSEFLKLLRAGAVTAVTYFADRPPAGSLLVKTTLPAITAPPVALSAAVTSAGSPVLPWLPQGCPQVLETLLFPGCHQGLFEELRVRDICFECAEVRDESDFGVSKLSLLADLGGLLASLGALAYLLRGNGSSSDKFSGRHLEDQAASDSDRRPPVTFEDVAGLEQTKEELREVISYLRDPSSFYALGARPPHGILLAGPSGTGKTLLARAVAGEAGVPFLYASGSAFVEIFVGQGAQRVRQFYEQARACAPCIVFLDELDAVGTARQNSGSGGNQEYVQTLNQLLLELDGIESTGAPGEGSAVLGGAERAAPPVVVTMAATNRYDCLDEALVRPGRLDRIVIVGLPNLEEREATLKIHARKLCTEDIHFDRLASRTEGRSGADLANLLNEAALLAARRRASAVRMEHIEEVLRCPRPEQNPQQSPGYTEGSPCASPELFARLFAAAMAGMSQGPVPAASTTGGPVITTVGEVD